MGTTIVPIIWSKRLSHGDCPSATVRLRVAPLYGEQSGDMGDGLGGSIPQWEIRFESDALHKMPYQPSSRLSGLVSDCTGISVKGLGLALTCFSDVGRDGMDESVPSTWSKHSVSQVQVLIAPPNRPLGFSCEDD